MAYSMALVLDGGELSIPVLPAKLQVDCPGDNDKTRVLSLGEILILRPKKLRTVTWESFFPVFDAPFVTGAPPDPLQAVKRIQRARDAAKPIRFLLTGADLDVNVRMGVESFQYEERAGEEGDIYYQIKLCEWKDYSPRRVVLPSAPGQPARQEGPGRPGEPPKTKTYSVVKGDCLWSIAQRFLGDGGRYREIYEANKAVIDGGNKGTGNPLYTIYPAQTFVIP